METLCSNCKHRNKPIASSLCIDCDGEFWEPNEPQFSPEEFSGLNWQKALPLIGRVVEFSDDPDSTGWGKGVLHWVDKDDGPRFIIAEDQYYHYIRVCPETYSHSTYIVVCGIELPKPEVNAPIIGTKYFWVNVYNKVCHYHWQDNDTDMYLLKAGKVHANEDRAQAWSNWWINIVMQAIRGG